MTFSAPMTELSPRDRYKLLTGSVVPRPIAWVTSVDVDGRVNAAPFSFFNVFSEDPPTVVLSVQPRFDGTVKDTARNIAATGVFVVNLIDEELASAANLTAADYPPEVAEVDVAGLTTEPGVDVAAPRILDAPFSLECRRVVSIALGARANLVIGEIVRFHARKGLVDHSTFRVNSEEYHPVGRMQGFTYATQRERFELPIPRFEDSEPLPTSQELRNGPAEVSVR